MNRLDLRAFYLAGRTPRRIRVNSRYEDASSGIARTRHDAWNRSLPKRSPDAGEPQPSSYTDPGDDADSDPRSAADRFSDADDYTDADADADSFNDAFVCGTLAAERTSGENRTPFKYRALRPGRPFPLLPLPYVSVSA